MERMGVIIFDSQDILVRPHQPAAAKSAARFFIGAFMGLGAMMFLGCTTRMALRFGGGDMNALVGFLSFAVGVMTLALLVIGTLPGRAAEKKVTIGNKNFTEQYIVGQLMKQLLEARRFKVDLKSDLTSMALRAGMESGDIDICADYTGTAWMVHLKREYKPGTDNSTLYKLVEREERKNNFIWLEPMWNNNTYALASWPEFARKYNLTTLSDLAGLYRKKEGKIDTFVDFEFSTRPDGLPALGKFYAFEVAKPNLKTGTPGVSLTALKDHKTNVAMVFGTDASIAKYGCMSTQTTSLSFPRMI